MLVIDIQPPYMAKILKLFLLIDSFVLRIGNSKKQKNKNANAAINRNMTVKKITSDKVRLNG